MPGERPVSAKVPIRELLERFPPEEFERGATVIDNFLLETNDFLPRSAADTPPGPPGAEPRVGFVQEGLVRGVWSGNTLAPAIRATAIVSGDGRWFGADVFQFGKNLFRYVALVPTTASLIPIAWIREEAPRGVLLDALACVSQNWCTAASVLSLGADTLNRRTLLLLYDMSRLHPRPELEVRQRDIADMLGVTRQTLAPILKKLEEKGLISLGYAEIVIGDPGDLVKKLRRKT